MIILFLIKLFLITFVSTILFTYYIKSVLVRVNIGDNPIVSEHRHKTGTPTMGGIAFLFTLSLIFTIYYQNTQILLFSFIMLAAGVVGLVDDFIGFKIKEVQKIVVNVSNKVVTLGRLDVKPNEEVRVATPKAKSEVEVLIKRGLLKVIDEVPIKFELYETEKIIIQVVLGILFAMNGLITSIGGFKLGIFIIPVIIIAILGCINCINLIDGMDGLASGILSIASFACCIYGYVIGNMNVLPPFLILLAICLGFLVFNKYPASIFMGDTGSFVLGTGYAAAVLLTDIPYFGALALGVPILSVVISLIYRAKLIKLPTEPLHHTLSFYGWSETKIVYIYWGLTTLFCVIGLLVQVFIF